MKLNTQNFRILHAQFNFKQFLSLNKITKFENNRRNLCNPDIFLFFFHLFRTPYFQFTSFETASPFTMYLYIN